MAAVLREAFDPVAVRTRQAVDEASLLAIVRGGVKRPAAAKQAAAELMRSYASVAGIADDETRQVIEAGAQRVASTVAYAGLENGGRTWVEPLDYFASEVVIDHKGGRNPKGFEDNRLELRAAYGDWLTRSEAMRYLTTREGKTIPTDERAKNMGEAEIWLTKHVRSNYPSYSPSECAAFVRESFPHWPWQDWKRPFAYA